MSAPLASESKDGTAMHEKLLICHVYSGMFSDEVAVKYRQVSSFVPRDRLAAGQPADAGSLGKLRVKVFREGGVLWAVLPNETQTIIEVDESDLQSP